MRCPKCGCQEDRVIDSRASREGATIRRGRECTQCSHRFTTYEGGGTRRLDGAQARRTAREISREKLLSGLKKACQKRPVAQHVIEELVDKIVETVNNKYEGEVPADFIGTLIMDGLRATDEVAYVRFA